MTQIVILFAFLIFTSCGRVNDRKTGNDEKNDKTPGGRDMPGYSWNHDTVASYDLTDDETIIEAGTNMEWVFGKDYKPWTPGDTDVGNAEEMIKKCFEDQARGTINRVLNRKPGDYCKQFVGAVNSNGERILWINMFCKKELEIFKEWKDKIVYTADGGSCFVQITFNWDKNDGHHTMKVNGHA